MMEIIAAPLGWLMCAIYEATRNYGVTILLFAAATKVILMPLSIWVQKNSIKMVKLQPKVNEITAACAGDRDQAAEEQLALYKREKYHPFLGVVPMLIQIPLIIGLINVVYNPFQHLLGLDKQAIAALESAACTALGVGSMGGSAQLTIAHLIKDVSFSGFFSGVDSAAIEAVRSLDFSFWGMDLSITPSLASGGLFVVPILSALSSLLLSVMQNLFNVLQKEQGKAGQWGMAVFLTAFSLVFTLLVPAAIGVYWTAGNLMAIVVMFLVNAIYPPQKYIDYKALEESKQHLEASREAQKKEALTKEQKKKAREDYKRFFKEDNGKKELVVYSSARGTYKYFKSVIEWLLEHTDVVIHYVASDIRDNVFDIDHPRFVSYFIEGNELIYFFMKLDADIVLMTMPEIERYYYKRSIVRKDIEYIYMFHGVASHNLLLKKGALEYYDTVFCVGPSQYEELRLEEEVRGYKRKNLVKGGYSLIDDTIAAYGKIDKETDGPQKPRILIAPSWHEGNICEICIDEIIQSIVGKGYDIILRPHPEFVKRYPAKMQAIVNRYEGKYTDEFKIEMDYSTNEAVFTADVMITDWSTVCYEYSFSTKKPTLFVNTPMKVMNPDYKELGNVPLDIRVRDEMGHSVALDEIEKIPEIIQTFLNHKEDYVKRIEGVMEYAIYNVGKSAEVEAQYIWGQVQKRRQKGPGSL